MQAKQAAYTQGGGVLHLLKEVMMEFLTPLATSFLFHCPMQGPQALASTDPPAFSSTA